VPVPDDYLVYSHRHYGMDQDRYAWRPAGARAPIQWPGGASVACMVVVPLEFHMLNPAGKPFKHPGAMVTPYPDLRHYTTRDYGNRVGVFRILKALKAAGIKATVPINAVLLPRLKPVIDVLIADGHEIAAYGVDTDHIHFGAVDESEERAWVQQTRAAFAAAGLAPVTWMSPARQQSFRTLDLIAEAGFVNCLDWEHDTVPVPMKTASGDVLAVPLLNELDDRVLLHDRRQTEEEWRIQLIEAKDFLKTEGERFGGQVLGFTLTPYLSGQPFRTWAVREVLQAMGQDPAVWSATAQAIAAASVNSL
jgi:peptidoglycan/xylan/chitin deacetylase (PgdA/CDA1 family)